MRAALSRAAAAYRRPIQPGGAGLARVALRRADVSFVVPALLLGLLLGGLASARLAGGSGRWIADSTRGELLRVDALGRADARVSVGAAGDHLDMVQDGHYLVVVNRTTGAVTSVQLDSLIASGVRQSASADAIRVLVRAGSWFVADRLGGSIARIDPATLESTGRVWVDPEGVADATIDDAGTVWALSSRGALTGLLWADAAGAEPGRFEAASLMSVPGLSADSRLVAHERGVTAVSPSTGLIAQVGSARSFSYHTEPMATPLALPQSSPSGTVPISVAGSGLLVIAGPTGVVRTPVNTMQCPRPGAATVFEDVVFVPCPGRVLRLGPEGQRVADDIVTDQTVVPTIALGADRVYVTVPGAVGGVQILSGGRTRALDGAGVAGNSAAGNSSGGRGHGDGGKGAGATNGGATSGSDSPSTARAGGSPTARPTGQNPGTHPTPTAPVAPPGRTGGTGGGTSRTSAATPPSPTAPSGRGPGSENAVGRAATVTPAG